VSDLCSKIDKLQAQELELSSQIKNASKVFEVIPEFFRSQDSNWKSNVATFGVEECP